MSEFALFGEPLFFREFLEITCRSGFGCSSNGNIVLSRKAALESINAFLEYAGDSLGLSRI